MMGDHTSGGRKDDEGKLRYDLVPPEMLEELAKILTYGAEKYGPNNWQGLDDFFDRYYAAAERHIQARRKGEIIDPESGHLHTSHFLCCAAFLVWFDRRAWDQHQEKLREFGGAG